LGRGRPCFPQGFSCPVVLRILAGGSHLSSTGLSPSLADLSSVFRLAVTFLTPVQCCRAASSSFYPRPATLAGSSTGQVWAAPLSLATTQGIFSFPAGTKMFQFPAFPPQHLCVQCWVPGPPQGGFPIRASPALRLHTAYRGFSQCTAPFFGSCRLGILQAPFLASP
jgi:hypothetical protein